MLRRGELIPGQRRTLPADSHPHESVPTPGLQHDDRPHKATIAAQNGPTRSLQAPKLSNLHAGSMRVASWGRALNRPAHIAGDCRQVKGLSILRESFAIGEATEAARAYKYLPLLLYLPAGGGAEPVRPSEWDVSGTRAPGPHRAAG
jgi:hypothetical protein